MRYRWPFERAMAPIEGSTTTTVSGEFGERSGSAMTPSFICNRTAQSGSLVAGGAGTGTRAARNAEAGPVSFGTSAPRLAGRSGQYTRRVRGARAKSQRRTPRSGPVGPPVRGPVARPVGRAVHGPVAGSAGPAGGPVAGDDDSQLARPDAGRR